ncbi:polyketide synthase dehydratase domain-containing protein, partial [Streptomyces sp. NPDC127133]
NTNAHHIDLPTYAFQRERYWASSSEASQAGFVEHASPVAHPVLTTLVKFDDGKSITTGSIDVSPDSPWREHVVQCTAILPGAAIVECVAFSGKCAGKAHIDELTLTEQVEIEGDDVISVQVRIGKENSVGERRFTVHYRRPGEQHEWRSCAEGLLIDEPRDTTDVDQTPSSMEWVPEGADRIDISNLYDNLRSAGYEYGPGFQGLKRVWTKDDAIYAEVESANDVQDADDRYVLSPALLDACLQAQLAARLNQHANGASDGFEGGLFSFSWSGVTFAAAPANSLRAVLRPIDDHSVELEIRNPDGELVCRAARILGKRESTSLAQRQPWENSLFEVVWVPVPVVGSVSGVVGVEWVSGGVVDGVSGDVVGVLIDGTDADADGNGVVVAGVDGCVAVVGGVVECLRGVLGGVDPGVRVVVVTRGAVAVGGGVGALECAGVWGLVRSVQSEHPGRVVLLDVDPGVAGVDLDGVVRAALECGGSQLAWRAGGFLAPRLKELPPPAGTEPAGVGSAGVGSAGVGAGSLFGDGVVL